MNPEEVHACNPIADEPWSYLMFYLDTGWLQRQQEEAGLGDAFHPFDMTASRDPQLYQGLCRLHRQLWQEPEPLARGWPATSSVASCWPGSPRPAGTIGRRSTCSGPPS